MKKLLTPLLLALVGLAGGAGAGWMLKPPPEAAPCPPADGEAHAEAAPAGEHEDAHGDAHGDGEEPACAQEPAETAEAAHDAQDAHGAPAEADFVSFERQFIVPVVSDGRAGALMVLTLNLEVEPGAASAVSQREPKLRDALLRVLFEHAATGGFAGDFTTASVMRDLRRNLAAEAKRVAGPAVRDVLVADIVRQDR